MSSTGDAPSTPDAPRVRIGTAGWTIPRAVSDQFPSEGSGLTRYAARFNCAEINSTFYRTPRPDTLPRWAATTPASFRFAVKAPRAITHDARLVGCEEMLEAFLQDARRLGDKLGPVLVQLPPSLAYDAAVADPFFARLRDAFESAVVCEPRHLSWFTPAADAMLEACQVARVAADPARCPEAAGPGGWTGLAYWRLHGSPRMYYSPYAPEFLAQIAQDVRALAAEESWVIFDNTTSGAAAADALSLQRLLAA